MVTAASEGLGHGARLTVRLPTHLPVAAVPPTRLRGPLEGKLTGVRVLVVDDEADVRDALAIILQIAGAVTSKASSSEEGVRIIGRESFDLVIGDLSMPVEDGFAFIRRVRALSPERGGQVLAVALTAHAREEERTRAIEAGYHHHLPKPIEPDVLVSALVTLLKNHGMQA
jgi:CheY-like chemotaxis protein